MGKTKRKVTDDPRPTKYRNMVGYNDYVRNAVINHCSNENHDITMRFMYPKAPVQYINNDHDYLKLPVLEQWVENGLKVRGRLISFQPKSTLSCVHLLLTTHLFCLNKTLDIYLIPPYHIVSHRTISYPTVPYRIPPYHIESHRTISYPTVPYRIPLYHIVSHRTISYPTIPYRIPPYHIVSHRTILYRTVPFQSDQGGFLRALLLPSHLPLYLPLAYTLLLPMPVGTSLLCPRGDWLHG
ncbi:unnamed protein product [Owenia fusiformis]|uniref:Uncharacterized protein n=1 Tax=Owenia fusiformis TaxID=6347 RepID=A0A8S4NI20_OWEFU|nr:unnamed protein product [Owenia fusiformis]